MRLRQFSLLTLLVLTSVAAVLCATLPRYFRGPAHTGRIIGFQQMSSMHASPGGSFLDFKIDFNDSDAERTPAWENHADTPPLSSRRALEIADAFSREWFDGVEGADYALESLELRPVLPDAGKWCWVANYRVSAPDSGKLAFMIRMDGVVLTRKR